MAKKLYVGSLPYSTTEDELREIFEKVGKVDEATIIMDKYSGRSKGFGFIEMKEEKDATEAIEKLNGSQIGERSIIVNEARPMTPRRPGGGGGGGGYDRGGGGQDRY